MNSHSDIKQLLSAYSGDDLPAHDRTKVEEHLKRCPECRSELADLQITLKLLRTPSEVEPPPWMTARIMARVREQHEVKQSWLKRIFFPLYIKVPLEALTVLFVCVTGYYLSQMVGSELRQPASQKREELPAVPVPEQRRSSAEKKGFDSAPVPPSKDMPAASAPKAPDQPNTVPVPQPSTPVKPAVPPSYAPAPPAGEEHAEPAGVQRIDGVFEPYKSVPKFESYGRSLESAAPSLRGKAARSGKKQADFPAPSADAGNRDAGAPTGIMPPQLTIRLKMTTPSQGQAVVREALLHSGGSIIDEPSSQPGRIRARIPVSRLAELLERLGNSGDIVERPRLEIRSGTAEVSIFW